MDENFKAYSGPRGISFQIVKSYPNLQELVADFNSPDCVVGYGEYAMVDAGLLTADNYDYIDDVASQTDPLLYAINCELHPIFGNNGGIYQRIKPLMSAYYYDENQNYERSKTNLSFYPEFSNTKDLLAVPIARGGSDDKTNVAPHTKCIGRVQGPTANNLTSIDASLITFIDDDGNAYTIQEALANKADRVHTHVANEIFFQDTDLAQGLIDLNQKIDDTFNLVAAKLDTINRKAI